MPLVNNNTPFEETKRFNFQALRNSPPGRQVGKYVAMYSHEMSVLKCFNDAYYQYNYTKPITNTLPA